MIAGKLADISSMFSYGMRRGKSMAKDRYGEGVAGKIVGIAIGLFVCASIIPSALVMMSNETALAGVDPTVSTLFLTLLPILAVVAIAMYFLGK